MGRCHFGIIISLRLRYEASLYPHETVAEMDVYGAHVSSWFDIFSNEKRRQLAVDQSGALAMRGSEELGRIVDVVRDYYRTQYAAISIIDKRVQTLLAQRGLGVTETPRSTAFCAVTVRQGGRMLVIPDARSDPRFEEFDSVRYDPFVRFYAGAPITDSTGMALGAICVADSEPLAGEFDHSLLVMMAHEVERELASSMKAVVTASA
jgi:GAF domain-containing protein